ncbi:hypothetical protein [Streptomyces sp. NPDC102487]|uniref:hypothetical protein n=1 Tax=Streptomyces sp. NPDC102487 TaxID=3366182 RepID=UPI003828563C
MTHLWSAMFFVPLAIGLIAATTLMRARQERLRRIAACMVLVSYAVIAFGLFALAVRERR